MTIATNRRRGRPKFADGIARGKIVRFRVRDAERKKYISLASKQGQDLSQWIRHKLSEPNVSPPKEVKANVISVQEALLDILAKWELPVRLRNELSNAVRLTER